MQKSRKARGSPVSQPVRSRAGSSAGDLVDPQAIESIRRWPPQPGPAEHVDISVIIPCFRIAPTIASALCSIAGQRGLPPGTAIEVILVVDGLLEDKECIATLVETAPRPFPFAITCITLRQNLGAGLARCHAWHHCKGELVAMLDDDDIWHPDKLAIQLAVHRARPDRIASAHLYAQAQGAFAANTPAVADCLAQARPVTFRDLLLRPRFTPTTMMIRRALWPSGPEPYRLGEDILLNLMIASRQPILALPAVLAARSPAALPIHDDAHSLSRQRLPARLAQCRNYLLLAKRGVLAPWLVGLLIPFSLALALRRGFLDLADSIRRLASRARQADRKQ